MVKLKSVDVPTDGILLVLARTAVRINHRDMGIGTIYITKQNITWLHSTDDDGFKVPYSHVSLHVLSGNSQSTRPQFLSLLTDAKLNQQEGEGVGEFLTEVRFSPEDKEMLVFMYEILTTCCDAMEREGPEEEESGDEEDQGEYSDVDR